MLCRGVHVINANYGYKKQSTNVRETSERKNHSVAICSIQKGGIPYIDEWVHYNLAIGFEQIYIYDNSDDFELSTWFSAQPKQLQKRLVITHFPGETMQVKAYKHCWEGIRGNRTHEWIAFFDLDEFLVIRQLKKYPQIIDLLDEFPPEQYGLAINWVMIGFNNITLYEQKPVTLRFQRRHQNATIANVKTIVRSHVSPKMRNAHYVLYKEDKRYVHKTRDTNGNIVRGIFNDALSDDKVALYHFYTKSMEEFQGRCKRGDVYIPKSDWNDRLPCKTADDIIKAIPTLGGGGRFIAMNESIFDDKPWQLLKERDPDFVRKFAESPPSTRNSISNRLHTTYYTTW